MPYRFYSLLPRIVPTLRGTPLTTQPYHATLPRDLATYFDTSTRAYTLFSPAEGARYEIRSILVEPERVWIALDRFGEVISKSPGGFVRWNRITHEVRRYPLEFVVDSIQVSGDSLRLKTRDRYTFFEMANSDGSSPTEGRSQDSASSNPPVTSAGAPGTHLRPKKRAIARGIRSEFGLTRSLS